MGRFKGAVDFSANFEPQISAPLDARVLVDFLADLTLQDTWLANDGLIYVYKGIVVGVIDDPIQENNGLYMLMADNYSNINNWNSVGKGGNVGSTSFTDLTDTPNTYEDGKYLAVSGNSIVYVDAPSGTGSTYTNLESTEIEVGGVDIGMTFSGMSMTEVFDRLFYPELYPTSLKLPSSTFNLTQAGLYEIGDVITTLNFNSTFDRGEILPKYTTSGFRSGLPNTYRYTGSDLSNKPSILLTDSQSISNYIVPIGLQSWTGSVSFDGGEQPLTNKGSIYSSPLSLGTTTPITRSITGVYPYFGTSDSITEQTKQNLVVHNASFWQVDMVGEIGLNKQTAWIPKAFSNVIGVQFYNTNNFSWDWINLTPANSLVRFTKTDTQISVNGTLVDYWVYTHNSTFIGARKLRFHSTI